MTVKELITKMNGVECYGIYFGAPEATFLNAVTLYENKVRVPSNEEEKEIMTGKYDRPHCTIKDVIDYLDFDVKKFSIAMFDDTDNRKYLKANIYLELEY